MSMQFINLYLDDNGSGEIVSHTYGLTSMDLHVSDDAVVVLLI